MASPQVQAVSMVLNDPASDLPEFDGPGTDYIICSTPRSGSTLLGFLLRECKMMGVPHEYLHPTIHFPALARRSGLIASGGSVNVDTYLAWLRRRRSTANGVFGLKAHFSHIGPLAHRPSVAKWIEGARLIRIRRRDVVLQAISYYTALETGVWAAVDVSAIAAVPSPGYNGRLIEKCVSGNSRRGRRLEQALRAEGAVSARRVVRGPHCNARLDMPVRLQLTWVSNRPIHSISRPLRSSASPRLAPKNGSSGFARSIRLCCRRLTPASR